MVSAAFLQQILNGVFDGSVYAIFAIGLSLIFGILEVANFAHGEFYMLGAFMMYIFYITLGSPYLLAVALGILVMAGLGAVSERVFIHPVLERGWQIPMITTLAMSIIFQNLALAIWGADPRPAKTRYSTKVATIGPLYLSYQRVIVLAVAIACFVGLHLFVQKTKTGKAMRAVSQNREACVVFGIDVERISMITFGIGAGLSGAAAALVSPIFTITPIMGVRYLLKGFAVVITGGFGNVKGAVIAAYILGIGENFAAGYIAGEWRDAVAFGLMIIVLLFRPHGIFGRKVGI